MPFSLYLWHLLCFFVSGGGGGFWTPFDLLGSEGLSKVNESFEGSTRGYVSEPGCLFLATIIMSHLVYHRATE